jgi:hypothetical protein
MKPEAERLLSRLKHLHTENVTIINTSGLVGDHFGTIYTRDTDERDTHYTPKTCCKYTISARGEHTHLVVPKVQYKVSHKPTRGYIDGHSTRLNVEMEPMGVYRNGGKDDPERVEHHSRVLVFTHFHFKHYGHFKHDALPALYQACNSRVYDLILIPGPMPVDMKTFTDIKLNNVKLVSPEEEISFTSDVVDWETSTGWDTWVYHNWFFQQERKEIKDVIDKQIDQLITVGEQNKMIYCQRVDESCSLGRILSDEQDLEVQQMLSKYATDNGLEYIKFSSCKGMTHLDQIKLFREAKVVVGLHGTALSNLHYVDSRNDCKVLEFSNSARLTQYGLSGGMLGDYMDYYISPIVDSIGKVTTRPSSMATISMSDLEHFLNGIK